MSVLLGVPVGAAYHLVFALSNVFAPVLGGLAAVAAIVVFTAAVRLLVMPLTFRALRGQAAQAGLAPQVKRLRERFARQPERLQRELTALYQRAGVSVFAGVAPLLVQWPVFSVLYLLFRSPTVSGGPNRLLSGHLLGVPLGSHWLAAPGVFSAPGAVFAGVLAGLAVACWLSARVARRMSPAAPAPAAGGGALALAGRVLPYLTVVIAAFAPLAGAIYLITSTGWSAAERFLCTARAARQRKVVRIASGIVVPLVPGGPFPPIRRLGPDDLKRCIALSLDRGWSPERAKWSLLLEAAEAFGVDAPDGKGLAGAVVLARYGSDLASVGMMLVAARYGRRGLGRALMEHLLAEAGSATVTLFATDQGRPLYEKLGFQPVRRNVAFAGTFRPSRQSGDTGSGARIRAATQADMPAIRSVDRAVFGADRGHILIRLPELADGIAVLEAGEAIAGYAIAWRNHVTTTLLGPVVAPDGEAARQLIANVAARARTPVRLDVDPDRPGLPGWAHARGLEPVSRNTVMARGDLTPRGIPERAFAPISVALA